jgi:hypothetical protein
MNEAEERAKFEAQNLHLDLAWNNGKYVYRFVEAIWQGWKARAALAEPAAEPVAWAMDGFNGFISASVKATSSPVFSLRYPIPLYAHPPRAPLTEEQIAECVVRTSDPVAFGRLQDKFLLLDEFARAIEAAHGIKESE